MFLCVPSCRCVCQVGNHAITSNNSVFSRRIVLIKKRLSDSCHHHAKQARAESYRTRASEWTCLWTPDLRMFVRMSNASSTVLRRMSAQLVRTMTSLVRSCIRHEHLNARKYFCRLLTRYIHHKTRNKTRCGRDVNEIARLSSNGARPLAANGRINRVWAARERSRAVMARISTLQQLKMLDKL